jgi:hypothetical protein
MAVRPSGIACKWLPGTGATTQTCPYMSAYWINGFALLSKSSFCSNALTAICGPCPLFLIPALRLQSLLAAMTPALHPGVAFHVICRTAALPLGQFWPARFHSIDWPADRQIAYPSIAYIDHIWPLPTMAFEIMIKLVVLTLTMPNFTVFVPVLRRTGCWSIYEPVRFNWWGRANQCY